MARCNIFGGPFTNTTRSEITGRINTTPYRPYGPGPLRDPQPVSDHISGIFLMFDKNAFRTNRRQTLVTRDMWGLRGEWGHTFPAQRNRDKSVF